jgi:oxalate---CoA ligase
MSTDDLSQVDSYPAKRPKTGRPKRLHDLVNISQLRAENEIKRVVDESGGIANVSSKDFLETYAHVISSMVEAGEPTSMPIGTQPDRRTTHKLLERLVDRGKLKTLTITITSRTAQSRLMKLIYDPSITQERLGDYVSTLREDVPGPSISLHTKLNQPLQYTRPKFRRIHNLVFARDDTLESGNEQDNRHDIDLSGEDDDVIRSTFLSEAQIVAQLYGYLIGKARRARELHQFTLAQLQSPNLASHIVSRTERIVAFPYFFHDLPVSTYCAIISVTNCSQELSQLMETLDGRQTVVKDLPLDLSDHLKIGRARSRAAILSLLEILTVLKLVTPLQPSNSTTPDLSCEPNGDHPVRFNIAPTTREKATVAVTESYWRFNVIAPIYLFSETDSWPPPFHRDMFVRTADESMPFWIELEDAFLRKQGLMPETSMDSITGPCACSARMIRALQRQQSWISSYMLSRRQKQYLEQKWTSPLTGYTPLSDQDGGRDRLEHICSIISAPFDAVYTFFVTIRKRFANGATRLAKRGNFRRDTYRERRATEDRALLAQKAAEARRQLEADWEELVSRVHLNPLPYGSSTRLKPLRTRYLQSRVTLTVHQWEAAVTEAISGSKLGKRNPVLPFLRSSPRKPSLRNRVSRLSPFGSGQQQSVCKLIERYKDKVNAEPQTKGKGKETDSKCSVPVFTCLHASPNCRQSWHSVHNCHSIASTTIPVDSRV